jgi:hypothetical protein
MQLYTFTRGSKSLSTPASSLQDAILLLPYAWKSASPAGFTVKIGPVLSEIDYWKAKCRCLEQQLIHSLGERHAP